jgi:anaerobic magnesium-protoporphyrin IX monomethyl ester cyclase
MKTVLCAVNARFSHMSLALQYLDGTCRGTCETAVKEYTINDPVQHAIWDLAACSGDAYCFSCYIWNIDTVLQAAEALKKILPDCTIVFGGPEVSYSADELFSSYPYVDYIISGEGETALPLLLQHITGGTDIQSVPNLHYRTEGRSTFTF